MLRITVLALLLTLISVVTPAQSPTKNDYSKGETWLCKPGRKDACDVDLTTTIVEASGKLKEETVTIA